MLYPLSYGGSSKSIKHFQAARQTKARAHHLAPPALDSGCRYWLRQCRHARLWVTSNGHQL